MIQVANRACVRRVAVRSLKASKMRNLIAVFAILLTTTLFTALFTIAISVNDSFQRSNFLMVGGDDHGAFKDLTKEQMQKLEKDPLIKEANTRCFLGMGMGDAFRKAQVEVSYMDAKAVKHYFCTPKHGHLPKEGTDEAMTDTRVLKLLGVTPKVGAKFKITYRIGDDTGHSKEVTKEFTLSGWWEYNEVAVASHVVVPESYTKEVLKGGEESSQNADGKWTLGVMFSNSRHIEKNVQQVIKNSGFQYKDASRPDYISYGVNWGYTSAQSDRNVDLESVIAIVLLLLVIVFTGYLIIYNVFQISVTNDIRFYGLLKTIGMTGKQIKRIIRMQAMLLAEIGIPLGLLWGWFVGAKLAPFVMAQTAYTTAVIRLHAWVFIGAAVFSLITVFISCNKPGRIAAKVSPVEAVRYTETERISKKKKKRIKPASLLRMAGANLLRNRKKTLLVVISLSLAVILLNITVMFTDGFDMDLYLKKSTCSDFQFANADYFSVQKGLFSDDIAIEPSVMQNILAQEGIKASGCVYGDTGGTQEKIKAKDIFSYSDSMGFGMSEEEKKAYLRASDGSYYDWVQLYGMDTCPLQKLHVIKGDISLLERNDTIAAVYMQDDYDHVVPHSNWAKVGDKVTLRYEGEKTEKTYTVVAEVMVPSSMGYRYYGSPEFVMGSDTFIRDTGTKNVMHLVIDMKNNKAARTMEYFLKQYTQKEQPLYGYESKFSYEKEFDSFRGMFMLLGGVLSAVIAVVGILNFLNAVLTGMIARRREFAVLQSIGMTKGQLKRMLVYEGLLYTLAASGLSFLFAVVTEPLAGKMMENMFWFFRFHYTIWPVFLVTVFFVVIGIFLPQIVYYFACRKTIVERLKQAE